jgi:hypothetical protein
MVKNIIQNIEKGKPGMFFIVYLMSSKVNSNAAVPCDFIEMDAPLH